MFTGYQGSKGTREDFRSFNSSGGRSKIEIGLVHMIIIQGHSVESVTRLAQGAGGERSYVGKASAKAPGRWQPEVVFKGKKIFLQEQVETS